MVNVVLREVFCVLTASSKDAEAVIVKKTKEEFFYEGQIENCS